MFENCANINEINALLSAKFSTYNPLNFSRLVLPSTILARFNDSIYQTIIEAPKVTEAPKVAEAPKVKSEKTPKPLSKTAQKKLASEAKKAEKLKAANERAEKLAYNKANPTALALEFKAKAKAHSQKIAVGLTNWCIKNNAFIDCQNSTKTRLKFVFAENQPATATN